jgi:hypothetical protein
MIGNHLTDVGAAGAAGVTPLFVTTGRAAGRPPPPGVASFSGLEAATAAVLAVRGAATGRAVDGGGEGVQKARPAPAVTGRAWPGMPVGRGRPRP